MVASESCALGTVGATFVREVAPGEIVRLDATGYHSTNGSNSGPEALCIFEYVYFARPDSVLEGQTIHRVRQRLGEVLAAEPPQRQLATPPPPASLTRRASPRTGTSGGPSSSQAIGSAALGFISSTTRWRPTSPEREWY